MDKELGFDLGEKKFAKVTKFKNKTFVDIREFYADTHGEMKPSKKGVCLKPEQWAILKAHIGDIDRLLNIP